MTAPPDEALKLPAAAAGWDAADRRRRQGRPCRTGDVTDEDDVGQVGPPSRQRKIIHVDMEAFSARRWSSETIRILRQTTGTAKTRLAGDKQQCGWSDHSDLLQALNATRLAGVTSAITSDRSRRRP